MSPKHNATRALAMGLAAAALAAAPAPAQNRGDAGTGGARAPDRLAPDTRKARTPTGTPARTPGAPTVVEITPAQGFDWTSAAIGAAAGIAFALIGVAAASTLTRRSHTAPH